MKNTIAFTLVELLVVIAILSLIAGMLLPSLGRAKETARRTLCSSNVRQVNLAVRLYADDFSDSLPVLPEPNPYPNGVGAYYKQIVKGYLGLSGETASNEWVFVCPSDPTFRTQVQHAFTSYTFNGYETGPGVIRRITGQHVSAIKNPSKAVLVGEVPAFFGGSWHPLVKPPYAGAKTVLSFVDGHVAFVKIFWDGVPDSFPADYEPPPSYEYSWDGE
jgi:prepilin-type N-terminal cleavage/methylation domain-containing protein